MKNGWGLAAPAILFCLLLAEEVRQELALLEPLMILGGRGELHVAGGVQRSLHSCLLYTSDAADE